MTDAPEEAEVEVEAAEPAPEAAESADAPESPEEKAYRLGWRPEEDYKGSKPWVDYKTFLKRGEEDAGLLKANNRALEKEMAALKATMARFSAYHDKAEARAYERAMKDLQGRLDTATQAGDVQGVRDVTREIVDLTKDVSEGKPKLNEHGWTPDFAEAVADWKDSNPWYGKDKAMTAFAHAIEMDLVAEGVPDKTRLKRMADGVREEFPHKFTNPRREQAAAVEGVSPGRRAAGKGYSDLPPDAKAMCDDFVKRVPGFTREKYVKEYFAS